MVPGFGVSAECQSIGTIGKKQRAVARSRGLVIQSQKLSVGAYFELSFLLKSVYEITDCAKNQIFPSIVWVDQGMVPGFGVWAECQSIGTSGKNQRACYLAPKTLGAYFELLFLGHGFLIHLSNRSDSPRFRAPWKRIRQKYDIQQEPSLFKVHPLSCQYGDALCSLVPT